MKKAICLACAVLFMSGAAFGGLLSEEPGELHSVVRLWVPGDGDFNLFKTGYGVSFEYREWFQFPWGVGASIGLDSWKVNGNSGAYKYDALINYDGDATLIPLGVSMYFNVIDWDSWNIIVGSGFQYLIVNSDVSVFSEEDNKRHKMRIDNAILWNIKADYEYMIAENVYLLGGAGYQVDVMKADTAYSVYDARSTSFRGFFFQAGAKYLF